VLNEHEGAHGIPFETFVENFHMTYINGNDQPKYQTMERIKEASMYMGYRFKVNSFQSATDTSIIEIENVGVAPIYYDAFVAVNGIRASESLKFLSPGETILCYVQAGGESPNLTIESDRILGTQTIQYYGTENEPYVYVPQEILGTEKKSVENRFDITITALNGQLVIDGHKNTLSNAYVFSIDGRMVFRNDRIESSQVAIDLQHFTINTVYVIQTNLGTQKLLIRD
jgi:hypothetical protein